MTDWAWPLATLDRVVDGDSFYAVLTRDIGFHGTVTFMQKFRLMGINAPKLSTPAGREAAEFLQALMTPDPFTLTSHKPYKFGDEWMADVTLGDGRNVSTTMVSQGHAVLWDGRGGRPHDEG